MGSYRIEESPNKRAGCSVKACKDHKIKIQKGELRLGTWVDTERFQSWSYRHWGCITSRVLANILESISEDGEPNFDMVDGLEELSAENQEKVKKAIETGEIDEADKTDHSLLNGDASEEVQNEIDGSSKKAEADTVAKSKKRSRADVEEEAHSKNTKKTKGKPAAQEEAPEERPAKRSRARKAVEEATATQPEKPVKKSRKKASAANGHEDGEHERVEQEATKVNEPAKKVRGKAATTNSEKPKRGRKKKAVEDEE
ncbi:conserved hypothetical protein [Talaromyces stipitatus ATCC 10500]|uniref:PARP-type domain-containing protein n=1 Tax=Talaromyces stipitatus (strain ATCC 10500 / CBS 375.48 / QM 6759 / NRRL 1006) TaxID=441959 RepID=B8M5J3_TALSN|nr:uncharacterized protein TSTA_031460 [Talaromyces stipitatus ATCC 10500]EED19887.1 conserved hypothetical protein [Talaromyces stipitatus ATCC 10500]